MEIQGENILNPTPDQDTIARLTIELDKYRNMESELRSVFAELKDKYKLDFSGDLDWGDLIGDLSGVLRRVMFSKKEQKELEGLVGRLKTTIHYFTNGDNK